MLLAYVDESGDPGKRKGATRTYTLGCVLVDADQWPKAFEDFLKFRRELRDEFKIRTSDEIKANYLLHDGGNVGKLGLSFDQKREIYQRHMHLVQTLRAQAFAVLIDKQLPKYRRAEPRAIVEVAWFYLAQRLERACRGGLISLMVIHDEGDNAEVRRCLRRARRNLWTQEHYGGAYRRSFQDYRWSTTQCPASHITRTSRRWQTWWPMRRTAGCSRPDKAAYAQKLCGPSWATRSAGK